MRGILAIQYIALILVCGCHTKRTGKGPDVDTRSSPGANRADDVAPISSSGLAIRIETDKTTFVYGQVVVVRMILTNASDRAFEVMFSPWDTKGPNYVPSAAAVGRPVDSNGKRADHRVVLGRSYTSWTSVDFRKTAGPMPADEDWVIGHYSSAERLELSPGESTTIPVDVADTIWGGGWCSDERHLDIGEYVMTVELSADETFSSDYDKYGFTKGPTGDWTGRATSNTLTVRVIERQ